jgi:hypothetical protein
MHFVLLSALYDIEHSVAFREPKHTRNFNFVLLFILVYFIMHHSCLDGWQMT